MPCGYDLAQARQAAKEISAQAAWQQLRAVENGRVYLTDGNQYFNRPGPRLVESGEILAEIIWGEKSKWGSAICRMGGFLKKEIKSQ